MEEKMMTKKHKFAGLGLVCLALTLLLPPLYVRAADPIELKAVTFLPDYVEGVDAFMMFKNLVNERAQGELVIKYMGGGEVMNEFEQGSAVKRGVVDIAWLPGSFYAGIVPGVKSVAYSQLTAVEERTSGAYDYLQKLHKKGGLHYIGRGNPCKNPFFYVFLNKRVETPQDLAGLKIIDGITDAFLKDLGSVPLEVEFSEVYTAMERGTADGWTFQFPGISGMGWHEVTDYWIDHPFYMHDVLTIMNLKKWESLPDHLKAIITEAQIEMEREYMAVWAEHVANEKEKAIKAGMEPITFSPEDAKSYVEKAYTAAWENELERHPDVIPRMGALMTR